MASLKAAVNLMCKQCIYDKAEPGTWREQAENCQAKTCALWEVRPRTAATIAANRKPRKKFDLEPA